MPDYGTVPLETSDFALMVQCKTDARAPVAADGNAVSYAIYAPSGSSPLLSGTFSVTALDTGLYHATGIAVTAANGFVAGNAYVVKILYAVSSASKVELQSFQVS